MVDSIYEKLCLFLSKLMESELHLSTIVKTVKYAWCLIQNPETKVNINFLVEFGKSYWTPGYNWTQRNYLITRLYAHSSHEVLVQVFTTKNKIKSLINGVWKTNAIFQYLYKNLMILSHDEYHLSEGTMFPQKSTFNLFNGYLDHYLENMIQNIDLGYV